MPDLQGCWELVETVAGRLGRCSHSFQPKAQGPKHQLIHHQQNLPKKFAAGREGCFCTREVRWNPTKPARSARVLGD